MGMRLVRLGWSSFRTPRSGDPESRRKFGICIWIPGSRLTARPGMTAPLLPRLDLGPQPVGEPRDALVARGDHVEVLQRRLVRINRLVVEHALIHQLLAREI